jgi:hypothetical protein
MDDFVARAKARISRLNKTADEITRELGFPTEAKYAFLKVLFGTEQEKSVSTVETDAPTTNDEGFKVRIYHTVEGFLSQRMKRDLAKFQILWEELKHWPVATLVGDFSQLQTSGGLGFTDTSQNLAAVISTISWAIAQTRDETSRQQLTEDRIVEEAQSRGCSYALSRALALYIEQYV